MGCWGRITYRNGSYNIKIHAEFSPKTYGVFQARDWSHAVGGHRNEVRRLERKRNGAKPDPEAMGLAALARQ